LTGVLELVVNPPVVEQRYVCRQVNVRRIQPGSITITHLQARSGLASAANNCSPVF